MAVLSKLWKIGDYMSAVEDGCKNLEKFEMEREQIVRIAKRDIMTTYMEANSALRKYYQLKESLAVSGGSIDLSTKNYFDITGVSFGVKEPYLKRDDPDSFVAVQSDTSHTHITTGRYWLWMPGEFKLYIFQGTGRTTETPLNVWHIRYPDLSMFTEDAWKANTAYPDIPDGFIPYAIVSARIACVKEKGMDVPADWQRELEKAVSGVADRIVSADQAAASQGKSAL